MTKKLSILSLLLFSIFLFSCDEDDDSVDCSLVECEARGVYLEFIDKETEQNLLKNGSLEVEDIEITVSNMDPEAIQFREIDEEGIFLFISAWPVGSNDVTIELDSSSVLEMTIDTDRIESGCCPGIIINNIEVTNGDYLLVDDRYIQILIENPNSAE